jgi:hypothetical protein
MRYPLPLVVSLLLVPVSVCAQEPVAPEVSQDVEVQEAPTDPRPQPKKSYLIELVEFRLGEPPSPTLTAEEILDRLSQPADDNGVEVVQTFHLSAVAGQESMAQVQLQTAITTGVQHVQARGGPVPPVRSLRDMNLGTTLTVTAEPADDKIRVSVRYAASRIDGERPEDGPPDIVSFTLQSQLMVTPGQRVLLGGANGASSSYAAITIIER